MKRLFLLASLIAVLSVSVNAGERNYITGVMGYDQIRECLVQNQEWVPYPAYADRAGWDALMGGNKAAVIAAGEQYLDYEWKVVTMSSYLEYERSGNRTVMEAPYDSNNRAIACLFAAELAEGSGRFISQIIDGVIHTCEMTSWALSAHIASLGPDHRPLPWKGDATLELRQGDVSQMFAWIYYYLHEEFDKIHPEISRRLKAELVGRELDPYLCETEYWWMGFDPNYVLNNWCPWCNANALLCFMLVEDDPGRYARGVWKSMWSVDQYLNRIQGDGGIEEGPSYWGHSAGQTYEYLYALYLATGSKINLFDNEQIRGMGEYIVNSYVGDGWVVNFADASARGGADDLSLIYRYGKAMDSKRMMGYAAQMQKVAHTAPRPDWNVFGFLDALSAYDELCNAPGDYETADYVWYPETQFHYAKGENGFFLAAKGGYNDESHNHNDVGNFMLYLDNRPVIIDVGVGTYTAKTFSPQRYEIWSMQSNYHNVPVINGAAQVNGAEYRASDTKSTRTSFSANIAGAYPAEAAVRNWTRSYSLTGQTVTVADNFELLEAKTANEVNFMIWGDVDASRPGTVRIVTGSRTVVMKYDAKTFTANVETITLDDNRLSSVWGPEIKRLTLTAGKLQKSGSYKYVFSAE